jgi:hypothetical protein
MGMVTKEIKIGKKKKVGHPDCGEREQGGRTLSISLN